MPNQIQMGHSPLQNEKRLPLFLKPPLCGPELIVSFALLMLHGSFFITGIIILRVIKAQAFFTDMCVDVSERCSVVPHAGA